MNELEMRSFPCGSSSLKRYFLFGISREKDNLGKFMNKSGQTTQWLALTHVPDISKKYEI